MARSAPIQQIDLMLSFFLRSLFCYCVVLTHRISGDLSNIRFTPFALIA